MNASSNPILKVISLDRFEIKGVWQRKHLTCLPLKPGIYQWRVVSRRCIRGKWSPVEGWSEVSTVIAPDLVNLPEIE